MYTVSVERSQRKTAVWEVAMNRPLARGHSKISMAELQRLMRNPEFPDDYLKQFFTAYLDASRPFSPAIVPDPERVDVTAPADDLESAMIIDWANSLSRQRRQIKFK
jgi:hypothetical protein